MKEKNENITPPKLPLVFFRWFCHPHIVEDVEGDLTEIFEERILSMGRAKASLLFIRDVIYVYF